MTASIVFASTDFGHAAQMHTGRPSSFCFEKGPVEVAVFKLGFAT
jgi:hypothetical protein